MGKLYEARKHSSGGAPKGNQNAGKKQLVQNAPIESNSRDGVAGIIAAEDKNIPFLALFSVTFFRDSVIGFSVSVIVLHRILKKCFYIELLALLAL